MKFLSILRTKPWLVAKQRPELIQPSGIRNVPEPMIGLGIFLIIAGALFLLFIISYQYRMDYQDWQPAPEPWQLWANTLFLLMGSIAFQISSNAARHNKYQRAKKMLMLAGILTFIFLLGQVWAWSVMNGTGYSVKANPANSFFYLITGVHAAHIMGGLVAWLRALKKIDRRSDEHSIQLSIKLCAMYWHFFLVVWLFLFYMLLVT